MFKKQIARYETLQCFVYAGIGMTIQERESKVY